MYTIQSVYVIIRTDERRFKQLTLYDHRSTNVSNGNYKNATIQETNSKECRELKLKEGETKEKDYNL